MISKMVLADFLGSTHPSFLSSDQLWSIHRTLWAEVSIYYPQRESSSDPIYSRMEIA